MRLDLYLKDSKNIKSRSRAALLIREGDVKVNGKIKYEASYKVKDSDTVEVTDMRYVSRAGYKLEYAFEILNIKDKVINKVCLDIGSSTGGFTDFLIQNGADCVYSIDVGTGQFDKDLLESNKNKIKLFENTDIRDENIFDAEALFDIIVCDVSFISLTHIIPSIQKYLKEDGFAIILFKPQFEVGKGNTKKGIVKDDTLVQQIIKERCREFALAELNVHKVFESGILGGDGNTEYIFFIDKN